MTNYPPPQYPPAPPPRKRGRGLLIGILALVLLVCGIGVAIAAATQGGGKSDTQGPGAQTGAADTKNNAGKKTVILEVTGAKAADVTYGLNANQSQENDAKVPWKKTLTSGETLTIATVVAQNKGSGTISCKVTVNGKVVKENSSKGEYAVVTCTAENL